MGSLGVRTDATTGLIWMRHRWFDPSGLQRFLSRDVLGSLNRYEYCYNDPVNWMDLDGLKPTKTYVHGKPYWHDVVDGVPSYWNAWPDTLRKKEKKKKKKDKCSNDVAFTMIIYPWEAPQWPKPPFGPEPPGLPFPGTNMRYPENVDIRRNMRIARNRLQTSQGADHVDWFKQMVRNSGPWDFKQRHPVYQDFGNFHFGATGHAVGIGDEQLLRAAGWAQYRAGTSRPEWGLPWGDPPYGDDPADQIRIQQGIEWSEQEGF